MKKKRVVLLFAFAVVLLTGTAALAVSHTGVITEYHLGSTVPGRNVCVRTDPTAPGTGWICVWQSHLTKEIGDLLREAYSTGATCTYTWSTTDTHGHNLLDWVSCF